MTEIYHINSNSKHHGKCKFAFKLIRFLTVLNLFTLEVVQKCQHCQLCVLRENWSQNSNTFNASQTESNLTRLNKAMNFCIGGSRGREGRTYPVPKFLHFHAVFGENCWRPLRGWRPLENHGSATVLHQFCLLKILNKQWLLRQLWAMDHYE